MGSPDFAVPILEALAMNYPLAGVVTQPDRPAGRGGRPRPPAVKEAALRLGLPVLQPERLRSGEGLDQLQAWCPDLIVVAAFGQILRPTVLDLPQHGCLNVHASLLPRWRGAAPIQAALLAGDEFTGVTIMKMDPGVDTGPILSQHNLPIAPQETSGSLFTRLAPLGAQLLLETLPPYLSGTRLPQPQPEAGITYASMLRKEDGRLDLAEPAAALERRVRALNPWPGAFLDLQGVLLKVLRASVSGEKSPGSGTRVRLNGQPALGTSKGLLILEEVQPAGKRSMSGRAYLAGGRVW